MDVPSPLSTVDNSGVPLYSLLGDGEFSYISCNVILRSDGAAMVIPQKHVENCLFNHFDGVIAPVFTQAIGNLLKIRDHLRLQLDLECGNISEEYFDKTESLYLTEAKKTSLDRLKEEVRILLGFTHLPLDAEDIAEMLNCSMHDAEAVLKNYISEV
ncbi:MAG: hypothetical protein LBR16_06075 [Treponema sp.]|jgi:hypothetical protein|nr:hypothetical protein [Treponema sp.]